MIRKISDEIRNNFPEIIFELKFNKFDEIIDAIIINDKKISTDEKLNFFNYIDSIKSESQLRDEYLQELNIIITENILNDSSLKDRLVNYFRRISK